MRHDKWISRPLTVGLLTLVVWFGTIGSLHAKFMRPDIEQVPVERLAKNLEKQVSDSPTSVEAKLNLARLYAMGYAAKSDTAPIWKGREAKGVWFGFMPASVPFQVKPTEDPQKQKAAKEYLTKAVTTYEQALKQAPDNQVIQLGLAWCQEQAGDQKKAIEGYRKVVKGAWPKDGAKNPAPLGWQPLTAEAAGYLIPLLDQDKDKAEIAELKQRVQKLNSLPRPVTPIAVPLRDGLTVKDLVDRSAKVNFDADGSGGKKAWTWITPEAGWLVYDPKGTGEVESALQMFGNVSFWLFWSTGYDALRALDDNGDGVLRGKELEGLAIWCDRNGNGVVDPGEVKPLSALGIVEVSCRCQPGEGPDVAATSPVGIRFSDGTTRPTYDLILHRREAASTK